MQCQTPDPEKHREAVEARLDRWRREDERDRWVFFWARLVIRCVIFLAGLGVLWLILNLMRMLSGE